MKVIISYRRDDTGAITGRICDRLRARFGAESVYMDIDSNPLGVDYRSHIDESLKRCNILLAVIGRHWLGPGGAGARRIDDPSDLVRLEVTRALARGIRVVPLLIDETEMPSAEELPEDLRGLKFRQAFRVDSGVDFHHHLDRLCAAIAATSEHASKAVDSPLPPPRGKRDESEDPRARPPGSIVSSKGENPKPRISGLAIAAVICSVPGPILAYFVIGAAHLPEGLFTLGLFGLAGAAIGCGHLAIKRGRQDFSGNGLALIGLILGYLALLIAIINFIGVIHDYNLRSGGLHDDTPRP